MNDKNDDLSQRPQPSAEKSRRDIMSAIALAAGGIVTGLLGVPVIGFLLAPLFPPRSEVWLDLGPVADFEIGDTVSVTFVDIAPATWAGVGARRAAWIQRRDEEQFVAFSVHCTHLGCPVRWQAEAELFMCPCHGGVFNSDGSVAAGPVREPLVQYAIRARDGRVEIRTAAIPAAAD